MKLVLISDTHNLHNFLSLPKGDILVHAGDLTMSGKGYEIESVAAWLKQQSNEFEHIVFIAGNHDFLFESKPDLARTLVSVAPNVHYLQDEEIIINDIKFYGSPWQPWFFDWAFNFPKIDKLTGEIAKNMWNKIPDDTNVLITHGPPYGFMDRGFGGEKAGCPQLLKAIERVFPAVHVFGHIHSGYGNQLYVDGIQLYNASIVNEKYKIQNDPWIVEI